MGAGHGGPEGAERGRGRCPQSGELEAAWPRFEDRRAGMYFRFGFGE